MNVSIIIPVYNVAPYIEDCLKSVMCQTYQGGIECIIIDDCTEDDSMAIAERIIAEYNDSHKDNGNFEICFRMIRHERNRGLSAARNTGTEAATGDYVCYVDSDDEITTDCIEKLANAVQENPEAEMAIANNQKYYLDGKIQMGFAENLPNIIHTNEEIVSYFNRQQIPFAAWNKLIKLSFIREHGLRFKDGVIAEDLLWMFYALKHLTTIVLVKDVTYHYYERIGSITTNSDEQTKGKSYYIIYDDILHHLTKGREDKELARYVEGFSYFYLKNKNTIPAYKKLYHLYRERAKQYRCGYAQKTLTMIGIISLFGNPSGILLSLNTIRRKIKTL